MSLQDLKPQHYFELQSSGISDAIIDRYFASIEGEAAQEWLIEDAFDTLGGHAQQYATAPVKRLLEQSEHATMGGWICTANGQIKLVTIQDRVGGRGPTLPETAQILQRLGCTEALNLDGGSSSSLYLSGRLINRHPRTAARINNALGVFLTPASSDPP